MLHPILRPAIVLVVWSLLMLLWMMATRLPALREAKIDPTKVIGGRGGDLDGVLPDKTQWKAHNYNHLMEQPTLFYAVTLMIAVVAPGDAASYILAWIYVILRIAHSIWQATVNVVAVRAGIFTISSIVLVVLSLRAAVLIFGEI